MSTCKYKDVVAVLGKEIQEAKYSDRKFPSVVALMRRFGISRGTVARVLNEFKQRGVLRSVQGQGMFVSCTGASCKIAVLFPEIGSSEYYTKIVKTIAIQAQKSGYAVLFAEIDTTDSKVQVSEAERLAKIICENDVAGVIFQPVAHVKAMESVNQRILSVFAAAGISVVLCDCDYLLDVSERSGYDVVGVNNVVAGAMLYRHLHEAGARRIHYLTIADSARSHLDRLRGIALEHMALTGSPWRNSCVLIAHPSDLNAIRRHIRRERPDAFICGNDITAALLIRSLGQIGVRVPDDMLVTGFNDVSISWLSSPTITTVRQPTDVIGRVALQRLFERISNPDMPPEEILVHAPLVARDSTGRKAAELRAQGGAKRRCAGKKAGGKAAGRKGLAMVVAMAATAAAAFAVPALASGDMANPVRIAEIASALPEKPTWVGGLPAVNSTKADEVMSQPMPNCSDDLYLLFSKTGNRTEYQAVYAARTENLKILAAMAEMSGEKRYLNRVADYLRAICSERSWTMPAHDKDLKCFKGKEMSIDLGAAHRAYDLATAIRHVGDKLPPAVTDRVRAEIERRVLAVYRRAAKSMDRDARNAGKYGCWWFFADSNWNAVCHSQVVRTALSLVEDRNERAVFVEAAERGSRYFLDGFLDDGYCTEGSGYWKYGYGNFLDLTRAVIHETGGKVDLSRLPRAKKAFEYGFGFRMIGGFTPDFADGGCRVPPVDYLKLGVNFWPELRPLLSGALEPRTWFPCAQVYIGRTPSFSFAVKGGTNAELHNHNDVGSWNLVVGEVLIAGDPGVETYTARTFSSRRYESNVLNSFGHPVPVVAGKLQGAGREFAAKVVSVDFADARDEIVFDLSGAYPRKTRKLTRTVVFDRMAPKAIVRDDVAFSSASAFESAFVARYPVTMGADGKSLFVVGKGERGGASRVRADVTATGGDWTLVEETIKNPGHPSVYRVAVRFKKPVKAASVQFEMQEVSNENQ